MQLIRHRPAPPLDRYIECIWWSHRDARQDDGEHMLPSGSAQLIFALHDAPMLCWPGATHNPIPWSGSIVHGPQSGYYLAGPKPKGGAVGVSFRPGAAGAVLGASMQEITDRHVALEAIWGMRAVDLHHRLMSAADEPLELFRTLEQDLSARIHRPLLIHPAVAHALALLRADGSAAARLTAAGMAAAGMAAAGSGETRIADIQRASGYSPRHFIALFRSTVGLNPKQFHRIRRFNRAVRRMAARKEAGIGDIAFACGYADQAHLTREFRELAGITPAKYCPSGLDRPLHHRAAAEPTGVGR